MTSIFTKDVVSRIDLTRNAFLLNRKIIKFANLCKICYDLYMHNMHFDNCNTFYKLNNFRRKSDENIVKWS